MFRLLIILLVLAITVSAVARDSVTDPLQYGGHLELVIGDKVIDRSNWKWPERKVVNISEDGRYQLDNGSWYPSDLLLALVPTYDGFSIGDRVAEHGGFAISIKSVTHITEDGHFKLSDGIWYKSGQLLPLVRSLDGISVGDEVEVQVQWLRRKLRVINIIDEGDGYFQVENGGWYPRAEIKLLD